MLINTQCNIIKPNGYKYSRLKPKSVPDKSTVLRDGIGLISKLIHFIVCWLILFMFETEISFEN